MTDKDNLTALVTVGALRVITSTMADAATLAAATPALLATERALLEDLARMARLAGLAADAMGERLTAEIAA